MDIKEHLRLLEALSPKKQASTPQREARTPRSNIGSVIAGETVKNQHGAYFYVEHSHPISSKVGELEIGAYLSRSATTLALLDNQPDLAETRLDRALFLDTETTGLSGGVGTCAFLIGAGYFTKGVFKVCQYFMNDFNEEAAILHDIKDIAANFDLLVTYNGKSYDIPLISSRNIYQGMKSPFAEMMHFDLLHSVRRLWGHRLPNCSLTTAESTLLNVARTGDIPGYLIPSTYFQYLYSKDASPLRSIFYHNQQDIVTMVGLMALALEVMERPAELCRDDEDVLQTAKILWRAAEHEQALALYQSQLSRSGPSETRRELCIAAALNYKKLERWADAETMWRQALESGFHPLPYVELAKHFEHRIKDLPAAKSLVEKALGELDILSRLGTNDWEEYQIDLIYRRDRLIRKLA